MIEAPTSITAFGSAMLESDDVAFADLHRQNLALQAELDEVQPLISAALLTVTAFRLRDQSGVIRALRMLVTATRLFDGRRACV